MSPSSAAHRVPSTGHLADRAARHGLHGAHRALSRKRDSMIDEKTGSSLSRRSLVKVTATAAAVGGALVLAGPAATADAATNGSEHPSAALAAGRDEHGHQHAGDAAGVMVRVLDARLGTVEVFTPAGHRTITDASLAAQLARLGR